MADNIDKFVLEYLVNSKNAEANLKKLQDAIDKTAKKSDKVSDTVQKGFGKISAKFNEVRSAAQSMGGGVQGAVATLGRATPVIAAVAAVVAALGAAFHLAAKEAERLNELAAKGFSMGMSGIGLENLTRQLSNASGGRVSRAGGLALAEKVGAKVQSAYMDTMQNNADAKQLRRAGLGTVNAASGGAVSTQEALLAISKSMIGQTQQEIDVRGRLLGLNQNEIAALQGLATEQEKGAAITKQEAETKIAAYEAAVKLKAAQTRLAESWDKLQENMGAKFLPKVTLVVEWIDKFTIAVGKLVDKLSIVSGPMDTAAAYGEAAKQVIMGKASITDIPKLVDEKLKAREAEADKKQKEGEAPADKELLEKLDEPNRASKANADQFTRAITAFGSAVGTFTGAIDEQQAWAAWAGGIGQAAGLKGGKDSLVKDGTIAFAASMGTAVANTGAGVAGGTGAGAGRGAQGGAGAYDAFIHAASKKYGVDENLIRGVIHTESRFNPNAVSGAGAQGLMQLMPTTAKNVGVKNSFDPEQNIMGGTKVLAENLKKFGNVPDALRAYNGGWDPKKWGNKETAAYPGKVLAAAGMSGGVVTAAGAVPVGTASNGAPSGTGGNVQTPRDIAFDPNAKHAVQFTGGGFVEPNSREGILQQRVINDIAAKLGVPPAQLRSGSLSKGDVGYAMGGYTAGLTNRYNEIDQQLQAPGMMALERQKLLLEQRQIGIGLEATRNVGGALMGAAREGGREITIGQQRVDIIVNGAGKSPEQIANETKAALTNGTRDMANQAMVNQSSTSIKR